MTVGMLIPEWGGRRKQKATEFVRRRGEELGLPCCICRQAIDYSLRYPDPRSCSVQHVKSQSLFPNLRWEPSNWEPAHLLCNTSLGPGSPMDLGVMSD